MHLRTGHSALISPNMAGPERTPLETPESLSDVHAEVFPSDPGFPELEIAVNPKMMLDVFRRHLKPASGKSYQIQDCIPVRFRCHPSGSRSILQYALRLIESGNGRHCNLWVSCTRHHELGRTEQLWIELKTDEAWKEIPETLLTFEPLSFISELQMLVEVFPCDRRLPNLPFVLAGPSPELKQRLLACFGSEGWETEEQRIEPLRYRTEMGAVVRYTLRARNRITSQTQTKRFYVKVYRSDRGERTWNLLNDLCANTAATRNEFTVVTPIDYSIEHQFLVLEEAPGRSLEDFLLGRDDAVAAVRRVARAVAAFNQSDIRLVPYRLPEKQINYLKKTASLLHWVSPDSGGALNRIVQQVGASLGDVPYLPIQWDLKPDHIFLDDKRVTFIDLDTVALGDPVRDPAHLIAHVTRRIGMKAMPLKLARTAARAFLEEYFARVPAQWRERLDVQYAIALVETAAGIFKRQEAGWPDEVAGAIFEAEHVLSEGFGD